MKNLKDLERKMDQLEKKWLELDYQMKQLIAEREYINNNKPNMLI
jgi:phage shock protein A